MKKFKKLNFNSFNLMPDLFKRGDCIMCPFCGFAESKVVDSRATEDGKGIRRRRTCDSCNKRFTTYERVESVILIVIKKNGTRETFDEDKLLRGIATSCIKRPVTHEQMQEIVNDVKRNILTSVEREVDSRLIGEIVMSKLKTIDEVSYVRFASVYKQFKDVETFINEISMIKEE